ncbi:MAG TPA: DUF971 domain-containing protein [Caldilineaceae bacterium]|nr:DUF971 domain-containing protein [Caldilineaceae bacterium]
MSLSAAGGPHRPQDITVDRAAATLRITWQDGHLSVYPLRWLRANCPCATCREERRAALAADPLRLTTTPPPSLEITGAELVGNYAVRFDWRDGHGAGIYVFAALRASCPCSQCNPEGPPPLLED